MPNYYAPLLPGNTYHVFNRAVGSEKLFITTDNYRYFLFKMAGHILPIAHILTYSLLPNHFHFLIRVKDEKAVMAHFLLKKRKAPCVGENALTDFIMEQFSNWLNGYTKAFNRMYGRKGSLFMDYTRRSVVNKDSDITAFIFYIHKNAVHHKLSEKIGEWRYDGYQAMLGKKPTRLSRDEVIKWFGSKDLFIKFHEQPVTIKNVLKNL